MIRDRYGDQFVFIKSSSGFPLVFLTKYIEIDKVDYNNENKTYKLQIMMHVNIV